MGASAARSCALGPCGCGAPRLHPASPSPLRRPPPVDGLPRQCRRPLADPLPPLPPGLGQGGLGFGRLTFRLPGVSPTRGEASAAEEAEAEEALKIKWSTFNPVLDVS